MIRTIVITLLLSVISTSLKAESVYRLSSDEALVGLTVIQAGDRVTVAGGIAMLVNSDTRITTPGLYDLMIQSDRQSKPMWITLQIGDSQAHQTRLTQTVVNRVWIDHKPPTVSIKVGQPSFNKDGKLLIGENTPFSLASNDATGIQSTQVLLDGKPIGSKRLSGPWPNGEHRLSIVATDKAGNQSQTIERLFNVVSQTPDIQLSLESQGWQDKQMTYYAAPVQLRIKCSENELFASVQLQTKDHIQDVECGQTIQTNSTFAKLIAKDVLGQEVEFNKTWNYETLSPEFDIQSNKPIKISRRPVRLKKGNYLSLKANDKQSGINFAKYRINSKHWKDLPVKINLNRRGWYQIELMAEDLAGNQSSKYFEVRTGSPRSIHPKRRALFKD